MSSGPAAGAGWETRRCWRLTTLPAGVGGEVGDGLRWGHFVDADDAVAAVLDCLEPPTSWATLLAASASAYVGVAAEAGYCTAVSCSRCGNALGDEEEDIHELHFISESTARAAAVEAGWRPQDSEPHRLVCPGCQVLEPGLDGTPPSAAVEDAVEGCDLRGPGAGQLPLDGMAGDQFERGESR